MIISFTVENHRSIRDEVQLSMAAIDTEATGARRVDHIDASLLTVAAVYGPNASGKSNLLNAIRWLSDAVGLSLTNWSEGIPLDPFALSKSQPTSFAVELAIGDQRYTYELELDRTEVKYEALFHYPVRKRRRVFERIGQEISVQRGIGGFSGTKKLVTPTTLVLAAAYRLGEPHAYEVAHELRSISSLGVTPFAALRFAPDRETLSLFESRPDGGVDDTEPLFDIETEIERKTKALNLLRAADLGIHAVNVKFETIELQERSYKRPRVTFSHNLSGEQANLNFREESHGTQTWFNLIGPALSALETGSLILFDELDSGLHPVLAVRLVKLFKSPVSNPHGAQLIFTSHDVSLMESLNRDEIWFSEKDRGGVTSLGPLSDFAGGRVRKTERLSSGYLAGRYGAIPDVDDFAVFRALGLIE